MIRVMLAEDHSMVRDGLRMMLELSHGIHLAGEAANGAEAVALCDQLLPDVILMDVYMPVMDGYRATRIIHRHHPEVAVIGLANMTDHDGVDEMIRSGASKVLYKNADVAEILAAIREAFSGRQCVV